MGGHDLEGPGEVDNGNLGSVYHFPKEGREHILQIDKYAVGKFSIPVNSKDKYVVADCKDPREKRVLEFIVLIMYPEKPTWITVTHSNTIIGALSRVRKVVGD